MEDISAVMDDTTQDTVCIKVAGALKGVVRVRSFDEPTGTLRAEIARLLGLSDPSTVKMIAGGRNLQEDSKLLREYHITPASRVLVTKGAAAQAALAGEEARVGAEEARTAQLDRLKAALDKMASRDGRGLTDKYEFSLENQDGTRLSLSQSDRRALVMGLALHDKGKASLESGDPQAGLGELLLSEESFRLVTPSLLDKVDNLAMLLLDIVWCCYKLRDVSRLGVCSERLASARRMLEQAHGLHQERLRLLHGNFSPEQAIYVRLELLEGVVAFHSGEPAAAQQHLQAAQARWQRLQLSPAALLALAEMGYSEVESQRALRFSRGDLAAAVNFLTEQRERDQERRAERKRQRKWISEREQYGKTARGKYVDAESLDQLVQLGYDKGLAAEALRGAENDGQAALDVLGDPVKRGALQLGLIAQQMLEAERGPQDVKASHVATLLDMGFREKPARIALKAARNKLEQAIEQLQAMGEEARRSPAPAAAAAAAGEAAGSSQQQQQAASNPGCSSGSATATAAAAAGGGTAAAAAAEGGGDRAGGGAAPMQEDPSSSADSSDAEMEAELVKTVGARGRDDPLSSYDIDVQEDGEAIQMYLALLASGGDGSGGAGSSSKAAAGSGK